MNELFRLNEYWEEMESDMGEDCTLPGLALGSLKDVSAMTNALFSNDIGPSLCELSEIVFL